MTALIILACVFAAAAAVDGHMSDRARRRRIAAGIRLIAHMPQSATA